MSTNTIQFPDSDFLTPDSAKEDIKVVCLGKEFNSDEDIVALSDPPYYTACPNPWLNDFISEWEQGKENTLGRKSASDGKTTKEFFATVQNKLHWAITGQTAAELVAARVDSTKENMGLTTWKNTPRGSSIETSRQSITRSSFSTCRK